MKFIDIDLSFSWFSADYLSTSNGKSVKTFSAKTTLPRGSFAARITYTSATSSLLMKLLLIACHAVGDSFKNVLSNEITNAILPVISDLALIQGSILIYTANKFIDTIDIVFKRTNFVSLYKASGIPVSIGSLAVHYMRGNVRDTTAITNKANSVNAISGAVTTVNPMSMRCTVSFWRERR